MVRSSTETAESLDELLCSLRQRFLKVRSFTETICEPLQVEDYVIQSMPDVSPTRWHLAHTTWFFETFLLVPHCPRYEPRDAAFAYLFNSYYNAVGDQFPRSRRGLLSRPTVAEVWQYRRAVDRALTDWLESGEVPSQLLQVLELGIQHEQQHQELMLTDIKHVFSCNPLYPVYRECREVEGGTEIASADFQAYDESLVEIGADGSEFCFDNELPRHTGLVHAFRIQDRLVTNREYLSFIEDGGYERPEFWLSLGWETAVRCGWKSPLYWHRDDQGWREFTLAGLRPLVPHQPVCHVSYFEADAFARWAGFRLPTEYEWESAAARQPIVGNFAESLQFHPDMARPVTLAEATNSLRQCFGDVWEWTSSQYTAYPGYRPLPGALGEYNGKFMCNQFVLRGGSCATATTHVRATYRNFFPPDARWQFSGIRLAE